MSKQTLIRTIYLYLFALVGLVLLIIGGVMLIDLGLKMSVFKKADIDRFPMPSLVFFSPTEEEDFIAALEKCNQNHDLRS